VTAKCTVNDQEQGEGVEKSAGRHCSITIFYLPCTKDRKMS